MATIYNIKIKTVSAFAAYSEEDIELLLKDFLKKYKHPETKLGFESTEITVEKQK